MMRSGITLLATGLLLGSVSAFEIFAMQLSNALNGDSHQISGLYILLTFGLLITAVTMMAGGVVKLVKNHNRKITE